MNEEQKHKLIMNISNFYIVFHKQILNLLSDNNQEFSPLLYKALHEIYFYEDITPSTLSKRLGITIPNTSRCLHKLMEMDCVIKEKDNGDKRIKHIKLSPKGLKLVEDSIQIMDKVLLSQMNELNSEELLKISEAFGLLIEIFEDEEAAD